MLSLFVCGYNTHSKKRQNGSFQKVRQPIPYEIRPFVIGRASIEGQNIPPVSIYSSTQTKVPCTPSNGSILFIWLLEGSNFSKKSNIRWLFGVVIFNSWTLLATEVGLKILSICPEVSEIQGGSLLRCKFLNTMSKLYNIVQTNHVHLAQFKKKKKIYIG